MADTSSSFWSTFGPGLLSFGAGALNQSQISDEQKKRLLQTQGPLYNQQIGLAANTYSGAGSVPDNNPLTAQQQGLASDLYSQAGSANPQDFAAKRFQQQQALVAPSNEAAQQDLFRKLQAKGLLGVSSFGAVPGTSATPGVSMNPYLAALSAAQEGAKNQAAYQSLNEGQNYLNNLLNQGGMLSTAAQNSAMAQQNLKNQQINRANAIAQSANQGLVARSAPSVQGVIAPSQPSLTSQILTGVAKNAPAIISALPAIGNAASGLFSGISDWFGGGDNSNLLDTSWLNSAGSYPDLGNWDFGFSGF